MVGPVGFFFSRVFTNKFFLNDHENFLCLLLYYLSFSPFHFQDVKGCDTTVIKNFPKQDSMPLCHVISSEDGRFSFAALPVGDYTLIPFYQSQQIMFDVAPARMLFTVAHSSLTLKVTFCKYPLERNKFWYPIYPCEWFFSRE